MTDHAAPNLRRFIRDLLIILGVTLAMLAAVVSGARGDSIRLLDQAAANQSKVLLREVAELDGPAAEKLGDTVVVEIKEGGGDARLSLDTLRQILTEHGVNWGEMSLRGYALCRVELRRRETPPPVADSASALAANPKIEVGLGSALSVRDSLVGMISTLSGVDRADLRIRFADSDARVLSMSTLIDRFEFEPQSSTGLGKVPFVIRRWSGDRLIETIRVCAEVQRRCLALVITKGVSRGQTFTPSDVEVREVYLDTIPASPIADPAKVVGQNAMVSLRKGAVVFADNLRSPIVVKRGEVISVRCISGGVVVKTVGRAAEDGSINQVIKAHNERTQGMFMVRVTGPLEAVLIDDDAPVSTPAPGQKARARRRSGMKKQKHAMALAAVLGMGSIAHAQSSSLYIDKNAIQPLPPPRTGNNEQPERLSMEIARVSLAAVRPPDPHKFAVHDLVTIVINESTASDSKANFNTTKDSKYDGDATQFPELNLMQFLQGQIKGGNLQNGPQVAVHMKKDFTGNGEAQRSDTFTDRLTAQVIDVKPNGTLVLEARKYTKTDEETLEMVLTGTCRKEDVTTDNTLLSSQIFDLHLTKNHKGQLKNGTDKGWISKIMDGLFGF